MSRTLLLVAFPFGVFSGVACGGVTDAANDAGYPSQDGATDATTGDAGAGDAGPGKADAQCTGDASPVGRPAFACPVSLEPQPDAGTFACTSVADCTNADGGPPLGFHACRAGQCVFDPCLTDDECPTGQACGCASEFRGNGMRMNRCVPSQCRADADCQNGERCSPSYGGGCGSFDGFYCHSAGDTCAADACCGPSQFCAYAAELGHFVCQDRTACGG